MVADRALACEHPIHVQVQPVGRIFGVSHHNSELFALRRLLSVVKGATSFEDLATFDGVVHDSFRSACFARGMLADDSELVAALQEIIDTVVSLSQIRMHFARVLVHSAPMDAQSLFNIFVDDLCDPLDGADAVDMALIAIESCMQEMGRSLADADFGFVLPNPPEVLPAHKRRADALSMAAAAEERDRLLPMFTDEQIQSFEAVVEAVRSPTPCNVFAVIASAGCGKTVFANGLAAYLRADNGKVMCVAASALAAMLLTGGSTAHSALHIPIPAHETTMCNLSRADRVALKRADLIIWDECSMVHAHIADTVERSLRDVMQDARPFGGKTIVFMGDFKQLLPVVRFGKGHNHTIQTCSWWRQVHMHTFTKNWRAALNPTYTAFLEDVGNGRIDHVTVPAACKVDTYEELIEEVYGAEFDSSHQILALTLETCAEINSMCFAKLPGVLIETPAADTYVDCSDRDAFPPDYVQSLPMKGAPPFMLQFKIGAKYMCIRNLDVARGIINGTMLRLLSCGRRYAQFQVLTGKSAGSCETLMKAVFTITPEASGLPFSVVRRQYPIIPAYCLSVHKAQGQSLQMVGIVFESDPFTHGQLYVALSRVGGWERVRAMHQGVDVKNMVLKHLLAGVVE